MIQTILSTLAVFVESYTEEIPIFVLLFARAREVTHRKLMDYFSAGRLGRNNGAKGNMVFSTDLFTAAMGIGDVAVYLPFFISLEAGGMLIAVVVIMDFVLVQCWFCQRIYGFEPISFFLDSYHRLIISLIFIPLGLHNE